MKTRINISKSFIFNPFFKIKKNSIGKLFKSLAFGLTAGLIYKTKTFFLSNNKSYCENSISKNLNGDNHNLLEANILNPEKNFDKKYFSINLDSQNNNDSVIYIIYDKSNYLQEELKDIINEKIEYYLNSKNFTNKNKIKIQLIESSDIEIINGIKNSFLSNYSINTENADNTVNISKNNSNENQIKLYNNPVENYIIEKIDNLKNSNEPIVLIKSGFCLENINSLSFVKDYKHNKNKDKSGIINQNKINYSLKEKLDSLLLYYYCDQIYEVREHFRFLEKPENRIILVSGENYFHKDNHINKYDYKKLKFLSIYKDKNTKIIFVNNPEVIKYLKLDRNLIYVYYPPKMPNIMKNVELYLQTNKMKQRYEGTDLNSLFNISPMNFIFKFNFFRDEVKLNIEGLKLNFTNDNSNDKLNILNNMHVINLNKFERIKMQKLFSFPKRHVRKLAITDRKLFKKTWDESNKTILFVYLPNWAFLKENVFNFILYEANHLFDEIQITNSKNFTIKNSLYDNNQISDDLPQLFIIETGEKTTNNHNNNNKVYAFNYFRFSNELQNYFRNQHPIYKRQTNVENFTNVKFINSKNFKQKILDDKKLKEFIIEIKHEGCPSCFMLGKMFDHLSLKLKKHKLDNKIKLFRIDTENDLRYLGDFAATPTYLFCKKNEKGEITFMNEIPKPEFMFRLKKYSNYDLTKIRYHPNLYFGFQIYQNKLFLKPEFDPDLDINSYI